jgi:hypothetical protein
VKSKLSAGQCQGAQNASGVFSEKAQEDTFPVEKEVCLMQARRPCRQFRVIRETSLSK